MLYNFCHSFTCSYSLKLLDIPQLNTSKIQTNYMIKYSLSKAVLDIGLRFWRAIYRHCVRRQSDSMAPLVNTMEILTTCCSPAPTSILLTLRAVWHIFCIQCCMYVWWNATKYLLTCLLIYSVREWILPRYRRLTTVLWLLCTVIIVSLIRKCFDIVHCFFTCISMKRHLRVLVTDSLKKPTNCTFFSFHVIYSWCPKI